MPAVEYEATHALEYPILRTLSYAVVAILIGLIAYLVYHLFFGGNQQTGLALITQTLHVPLFGSAVGAPPALASGATHLAEVFTTGISGVAHLKMGNVNKKLFFGLLLPGIAGALVGTYILSSIDGKALKPYISVYLLLMGLYVFSKAFRHIKAKSEIDNKKVLPLAFFGGLLDTTGGGGWGPIVTTSLVGSGQDPRTTIGSVNFAEFFLTVVVAASFFSILDHTVWILVAGLALGGLVAAPFAAFVTKHLKAKTLLILVGSLISLVSLFNLYQAFGR